MIGKRVISKLAFYLSAVVYGVLIALHISVDLFVFLGDSIDGASASSVLMEEPRLVCAPLVFLVGYVIYLRLGRAILRRGLLLLLLILIPMPSLMILTFDAVIMRFLK